MPGRNVIRMHLHVPPVKVSEGASLDVLSLELHTAAHRNAHPHWSAGVVMHCC